MIGAVRGPAEARPNPAPTARLEVVGDPVSAPVVYGSNTIRYGQEGNAVPVAYGSNGIRLGEESNAVHAGTASAFQKVREA